MEKTGQKPHYHETAHMSESAKVLSQPAEAPMASEFHSADFVDVPRNGLHDADGARHTPHAQISVLVDQIAAANTGSSRKEIKDALSRLANTELGTVEHLRSLPDSELTRLESSLEESQKKLKGWFGFTYSNEQKVALKLVEDLKSNCKTAREQQDQKEKLENFLRILFEMPASTRFIDTLKEKGKEIGILFEQGAMRSIDTEQAAKLLPYAVNFGSLKIVDFLLGKLQGNISAIDFTLLQELERKGSDPLVKKRIEEFAKVPIPPKNDFVPHKKHELELSQAKRTRSDPFAQASQEKRPAWAYPFDLEDRNLFGRNPSRFAELAGKISQAEATSSPSEMRTKLEALKADYKPQSAEIAVLERARKYFDAPPTISRQATKESLRQELGRLESAFEKSVPSNTRAGVFDDKRARFEHALYRLDRPDDRETNLQKRYSLVSLAESHLPAVNFAQDFARTFQKDHLVVSEVVFPGHSGQIGHSTLTIGNGATGEYRFFDPNWGIFRFKDPTEMGAFVGRLASYGEGQKNPLTASEMQKVLEVPLSQFLAPAGHGLASGICTALTMTVGKWFTEHPDFKGDLARENLGLAEFDPVNSGDQYMKDRAFQQAADTYSDALHMLRDKSEPARSKAATPSEHSPTSIAEAEKLARSSKPEDWRLALAYVQGATEQNVYSRAIAGLAEAKIALGSGRDYPLGWIERPYNPRDIILRQLRPTIDALKNSSCMKALAPAQLNFAETKYYALKIAEENPELVRAFVEAGANLNIADTMGQTPIFSASPAAIKALSEAGANVNAKDKSGRSPLFSAKTPEHLKALIAAGADVNQRDNAGRSPLFYAKTPERLKALIAAGADVNQRDNAGTTLLTNLLKNSATELAQALIEAGGTQ